MQLVALPPGLDPAQHGAHAGDDLLRGKGLRVGTNFFRLILVLGFLAMGWISADTSALGFRPRLFGGTTCRQSMAFSRSYSSRNSSMIRRLLLAIQSRRSFTSSRLNP